MNIFLNIFSISSPRSFLIFADCILARSSEADNGRKSRVVPAVLAALAVHVGPVVHRSPSLLRLQAGREALAFQAVHHGRAALGVPAGQELPEDRAAQAEHR